MFTRRDDVTCIKHPPGTCSDRNLSFPAYATKSESLSIAHGKDRNYRHGTMEIDPTRKTTKSSTRESRRRKGKAKLSVHIITVGFCLLADTFFLLLPSLQNLKFEPFSCSRSLRFARELTSI
ncbi:hypothetical protein YC2023_112026 [Brassica napus]